MDVGTLGGIILGVFLIIGSIMLGGKLDSFIDIPSAGITIGGTIAAILITYPLPKVKSVFGITKKVLTQAKLDASPWYNEIIELATIARRDGVLALEEKLPGIEDPFLTVISSICKSTFLSRATTSIKSITPGLNTISAILSPPSS